eukprot:CAMPEP_0174304182 /NCGR_PEP_ID=MMETSP0809-20121228/60624_1 /TAXON_ID=73025 ORGANISM="Eutreptiella gymnastica-like, Strain CCMP1594" /NCGR_SAMPLE_ID=MMETSP0809 /ASSEMBLY_ACC=CAM_ASM_000658 /LENGTH=86 /DNA_ID=CAMNT_0015410339 /DNA_START=1074 /DNA_END=1334 /DNA_ORIENTATION=+
MGGKPCPLAPTANRGPPAAEVPPGHTPWVWWRQRAETWSYTGRTVAAKSPQAGGYHNTHRSSTRSPPRSTPTYDLRWGPRIAPVQA